MTISFADLFNKAKARLKSATTNDTAQVPRSAPAEKASSERLSKTVLPNTIRTLERPDASRAAAASAPVMKQSASATATRPAAPKSRQSVRSSGLGLEARVERTISLGLADIIEQIPGGYLKPREELDLSQAIQLSAAEIEKGMAEGHPSIPLTSLYEQAPEIFLNRLSPTESACVALPYEKVLNQFKSLLVRHDQLTDELVPQIDTPFLKVTLEDTDRFGTTMEPVKSSALPPVRVELASAETIAAATPEPVASQKIKPRSLPLLHPAVSLHEAIPKKPEAPPATVPAPAQAKKISPDLPPKGTGVPASERVPASSGPPVPTNPPQQSPKAAPIPFVKVSAPSDDLREKFHGPPPSGSARNVAQPLSSAKGDDPKIPLALNRILEGVPAFQLNGSPSVVPENIRVQVPFSLIQPQLASGRVVVSPTVLQRAMPEMYRNLLNIDPGESAISLPLEEILKNLPVSALQRRSDQEETTVTEKFETMFSIKAEEDAKRLNASTEDRGGPSNKSVEQPEIQEPTAKNGDEHPGATSVVARFDATPGIKQTAVETAVAEPTRLAIATKPDEQARRSQPVPEGRQVSAELAIQPKIQTKIELAGENLPAQAAAGEEKLDAKCVIRRAGALPGVAACVIAFADDGLSLAGGLPAEIAADGLCAMAPSLLQRIASYMRDTKLGSFTSMTLHGEKSAVTFFMHGNICLTALHVGGELSPETRATLGTMTWALSRTYSKPEPSHVDH
jgi:predicted regulator of Ras-like GTPase activity (Roadblock/LC7/MglB family)